MNQTGQVYLCKNIDFQLDLEIEKTNEKSKKYLNKII